MSDLPLYPPLDPCNYDLIVVGTGLSESIFAAAASSSGRSVLHLDPNPFYGSHFASLSLPDLTSFLQSNSVSPSPPSESNDFISVDVVNRSLYSSVEISSFDSEIFEEQHSRRFNVDLCGPRVVFFADESINLMLQSGVNNYVRFKTIEASFVGDSSGELRSVPDSREAIRNDKSLTLLEKHELNYKFIKRVKNHLDSSETISEEDMESPFMDFLTKLDLSPKVKSIILYAIAMVDYDQDNMEHLLKTKEGIDRLALYITSMHRSFTSMDKENLHKPRALMYPIYGQGELPQAFCRKAAVKGCTYVLRMPISALLLDKQTGGYKGVRIVSGQEIFSQKLILDPCITVGLDSLSSLTDEQKETLRVVVPKAIINKEKIARGICVIRGSVKADISNALIVYPPKSLFPEQLTAVRVLQLGSGFAVCPADMHLIYFSTLCDNDVQGIKALSSAISNLIRFPVPENCQSDSAVENDNSDENLFYFGEHYTCKS